MERTLELNSVYDRRNAISALVGDANSYIALHGAYNVEGIIFRLGPNDALEFSAAFDREYAAGDLVYQNVGPDCDPPTEPCRIDEKLAVMFLADGHTEKITVHI